MVSLTKYEKYILIFLIFTGLLGMILLFREKVSNGIAVEEPHNIALIEQKHLVPLNINTATEEELTALKGVGRKLAERIIEYRKQYGYFFTKEELRKVKGIGPAKYEDIKEAIRVE